MPQLNGHSLRDCYENITVRGMIWGFFHKRTSHVLYVREQHSEVLLVILCSEKQQDLSDSTKILKFKIFGFTTQRTSLQSWHFLGFHYSFSHNLVEHYINIYYYHTTKVKCEMRMVVLFVVHCRPAGLCEGSTEVWLLPRWDYLF